MSNKEGVSLSLKANKTRSKLKNSLIKKGLLPNGYPYTKIHEELMDLLMANQFDVVRNYRKENCPIIVNPPKPKMSEEEKKHRRESNRRRNQNNSFLKKVFILQSAGLLPEDIEGDLNQQHTDIIGKLKSKFTAKQLIEEYINDANIETKQEILFKRLKLTRSNPRSLEMGHYIDLKPQDIIVNEYCPFLGVKIDYRKTMGKSIRDMGYSFDRIQNEKSYVSGNVWIISRLANIIKNDSTLEELKTFCINIIKQYETNQRF